MSNIPSQTYSNQKNSYVAQPHSIKRNRVFPNLRIILIIVAIICFIGGIANYAMATDVKNNYRNSEYLTSKNHNAYVGGDAYNYIINSNYFTGYTVASVGLFLCGVLSLAALIFISAKEKEYERLDFQNATLSNIEILLTESPELNQNTYTDNVDASIELE